MSAQVWDLIVVGGGAAGLAAALTAARRGRQVLILERTNECGKKLAVTGGKKGNFTHADEPDVMARQYNTESAVLRRLMRRFPYTRIVGFFEDIGILHLVDEEGCVWPNPKSAPRLRDELVSAIGRSGGRIATHAHVTALRPEPGAHWHVQVEAQGYAAKAVLLATGGLSYPATGSSGDGFRLAQELGHSVEPPYSALASLVTRGEFRELAGITVGRTRVRLRIDGQDIGVSETAPFLFAGSSITGRAIINISGFAARALQQGRKAGVIVDWLPETGPDDLAAEIADQRIRHGRMHVGNFIAAKSAKRLATRLCELADLPPDRKLAELTRDELRCLLNLLKGTEIAVTDAEPLARATVTGGGVALTEVSLETFESLRHPGLHCAGELLDVWGRSGGYNLHFAWASGIAVGEAV
jgi:hypothetical protein